MQQFWDQILHLIGLIVSPDWGSLVALIPLGVAAVVVLYMAWLLARLATVPPKRIGRRRLAPQPPPGTHLPGGSISPLLISGGAAILLFGLVFRGPILPIGVVALLLAVLNWGREAMRDYQHVAGVEEGGAALLAQPQQLPPGVHLPGPSFRPVLVSIAMAVLLLGLVFGPALLVAGVIMLLVTLFGWLRDARVEYRAIEEADRSGHLVTESAPGVPVATLTLFAVLVVGALAIHAGVLSFASGGTPAGSPAPASPAPAASGGGSAAPGGSSGPGASASTGAPGASGGGGGQAAVLKITAQNIAFDTQSLTAPANTPITITFTNNDQGVPHNVSIHKESPTGAEVWKGDIVTGPATATYNVPPLPAGTYGFVCSVHPNMTGTLTVK